ncbi:DgyrCDS2039 [Dimorphilus gyrociliatus]|uniref:DgyrCDS2039 n=1 Tax=Dimorphilus gyrociliatus TaxID=2664684 RepID=A0A7I8V9A4_9ANNE|nr:DgyrCDS2039 [Dimorphilus gyrociliatus]
MEPILIYQSGSSPSEELITSGAGAGSGCQSDDEDDCSNVTPTPRDALITPVFRPKPITKVVIPSSRPVSTPKTLTETIETDDEDYEGSASIKSTNRPKYTTTATVSSTSMPVSKRTTIGKVYSTVPTTKRTRTTSKTVSPVRKSTTTKEGIDLATNSRTSDEPSILSVEPTDDEPFNRKTTVSVNPASEPPPNEISTGKFSLNLGLIIGVACGVLVLLLIVTYVLYKYRARDDGSYKVDESKNYIAYQQAATKPPPTETAVLSTAPNAQVVVAPTATKSKKDVKEWFV